MRKRNYLNSGVYEVTLSAACVPQVVKLMRKAKCNDWEYNNLSESVANGAKQVEVNVSDWTDELIDSAIGVLTPEDYHTHAYLVRLSKIRKSTGANIRKLKLLPEAMALYLVEDSLDGWVYKDAGDGHHIAYVVVSIGWEPEDGIGWNRRPEYAWMTLRANRADFSGEENESRDNGLHDETITWAVRDVHGRVNAAAALVAKGVLKETPELRAKYRADHKLFQKNVVAHSMQFHCTKQARSADSSDWSKRDKIYPLPHPTKMVNEEDILNRHITLFESNSYFHRYGVKEEADERFARIPTHPYILFFDLTRHTHVWVHVTNCKPYVYDPSLREKLVLPDNHRDLIDVLTTDMDVFVEDIIEGKSGGTAILCYGSAGLGKTLTAEVYSEIVKRPLYRVHAGQLGTDVQSVENQLEVILRRSERWGSVLLLDEADVYIRQRGNDIAHNAVVAAFLRTLEYFHGLLFMTTNRAKDVDDAIASRMIAMFKYDTPDKEQATAIWTILSKQFGITLTAAMINQLATEFNAASGRDIKQLLKLTKKYCTHKQRKMDVAAFRICAMFRGIV